MASVSGAIFLVTLPQLTMFSRPSSHRRFLVLPLALAFWGCVPSQAQPAVPPIAAFDHPYLFGYGTWDKVAKIEGGHLIIQTPTGQGGLGDNFTARDFSKQSDLCPALRLRVGPNNKETTLRLMLSDAKGGASTWNFSLDGVKAGDDVLVTPVEGAALSTPSSIGDKGAADLTQIFQWQVQGDWSQGAVDVTIQSIELIAPNDAVRAARAAGDKRRADDAEKLRVANNALKAQYPRSDKSPVVENVAPIAPDVLAIQIHSGHVIPSSVTKYVPQTGDSFNDKKDDKGTLTERHLLRGGKDTGYLIGPKRDWLSTHEGFQGDPLLEFEADDIANFSVSSPDDAAFKGQVKPVSIARKSKPGNWALESSDFEITHTLYLRLPQPMQSGKHYTVSLGELNTQQTQVAFVNDSSKLRSEAVHVNQIGYRPDDPGKRALVSCWMGSGGTLKLPPTIAFSLVDDKTGRVVYSGKSSDLWPADKVEHQQRDANFSGTDVMRLDFSDFQTLGRYRVVAQGFGSSYPFNISPNVWNVAFRTQMRGLFNQRSGIALGPPYTKFVRPRDLFPGDEGVRITQSSYRNVGGGDSQGDLAKGDTGVPVPGAYGGYHDAGDWNPRRVSHMKVTMASLELFDLFPAHFAAQKLNIPPMQGQAKMPDVLNEAIFEFECFHRLQHTDGGVPFGIETNGDPYTGEVSYHQTMPLYVYAPDYDASWTYAAVAARLAFLVGKYDPKLGATYSQSAIRAYNWAVQDFAGDPKAKERDKNYQGAETRDARALAALELLRLTRDPKWHDEFLAANRGSGTDKPNTEADFSGVSWERHDAAFLYARLPVGLGDAQIKGRAKETVEKWAGQALAYGDNNAWNLTTSDKGKPQFIGFYSGPDAVDLTRAHFLTGDQKYLEGAVRATQFGSGANPLNMVYTSGLGANPVKHPFNLDARRTGQDVPEGFTPYGNVDFAKWGDQQWITWPITYFLSKNTTPNPLSWPTNEAYWDTGGWPALNEFTVDSWTPNVAVWGYLAARK